MTGTAELNILAAAGEPHDSAAPGKPIGFFLGCDILAAGGHRQRGAGA